MSKNTNTATLPPQLPTLSRLVHDLHSLPTALPGSLTTFTSTPTPYQHPHRLAYHVIYTPSTDKEPCLTSSSSTSSFPATLSPAQNRSLGESRFCRSVSQRHRNTVLFVLLPPTSYDPVAGQKVSKNVRFVIENRDTPGYDSRTDGWDGIDTLYQYHYILYLVYLLYRKTNRTQVPCKT